MKTNLILIRHGYSTANEADVFAGFYDAGLTAAGVRQAEKCAAALKEEHIDAVYASDLRRAFCTAKPVAESHGLPLIPEPGMREICAGEWEGLPFRTLAERFPEDFGMWMEDIGNSRCTGGESVKEFSARILAAVDRIAAANPGKTVCIGTHATPIRAVCTAAAGLPAGRMAEIPWVRNASISRFVWEDGVLTAVSVGETDHLGDDATPPLPDTIEPAE